FGGFGFNVLARGGFSRRPAVLGRLTAGRLTLGRLDFARINLGSVSFGRIRLGIVGPAGVHLGSIGFGRFFVTRPAALQPGGRSPAVLAGFARRLRRRLAIRWFGAIRRLSRSRQPPAAPALDLW